MKPTPTIPGYVFNHLLSYKSQPVDANNIKDVLSGNGIALFGGETFIEDISAATKLSANQGYVIVGRIDAGINISLDHSTTQGLQIEGHIRKRTNPALKGEFFNGEYSLADVVGMQPLRLQFDPEKSFYMPRELFQK